MGERERGGERDLKVVEPDVRQNKVFAWKYELNIRHIRKIAKSDYLLHVCLSVCLSAWNNSAPIGRILMKCDIRIFLDKLSIKCKFHYNRTRITGTLHEYLPTLMAVSRSVLFVMRNVSDKSCRENTHILLSVNLFFRKSCRLWDNAEKYCTAGQATDNNIIRRKRIACRICKETHTITISNKIKRTVNLMQRCNLLKFL